MKINFKFKKQKLLRLAIRQSNGRFAGNSGTTQEQRPAMSSTQAASSIPGIARLSECVPDFGRLLPLAIALLVAANLTTFSASAQSLWHEDTARSIYADKRGSAVGDIITIVVQENTTANKNNETKTEKNSSLSAAITSFLYPAGAGTSALLSRGGQMPAMAYNSDLKHDGSGSINNSESIVAHVACVVKDVTPNGNLIIEGRRETSFSGEHQTIVLHGIVRGADVQSDNTVLSYNVADATIQIIGKGAVTESQRKGWFTKLYEFANPF